MLPVTSLQEQLETINIALLEALSQGKDYDEIRNIHKQLSDLEKQIETGSRTPPPTRKR
jgi:hypothetical protein